MADVLVQRDWEILGFIITSYIGIVINISCIIHFIYSTYNHKRMKTSMKYSAYISFIASLIYCIMNGLFRTNIIFQSFNFNATDPICNLSYGVTYCFYVVARFGVYILFCYRLQIVFIDSPYAISKWILQTIRIIIIILAFIYIPGISLFLNKQEVITPIFHISLCTGNTKFVRISMYI